MNFVIGSINVILISYIGYLTFRTTERVNRLNTMPVIDFTVKKSTLAEQSDSWYLLNCSTAPAKNIRLRFNVLDHIDKKRKFTKWIATYSLGGASDLELIWMRDADAIEVVYSDAFEERFFKMTFSDFRGLTTQISKTYYETILRAEKVNSAD